MSTPPSKPVQDHYDTIEYFDKKIGGVDNKMLADVADDPVVKQLLRQAGIGPVTAITLRAIIGHFDRFRNGKQLAHFCALCPRNDSSAGKTTTGGLIKAGDELLRQVLIESAHRLIRFNPEWRAMADRLRANGKKTCVIVAAVANRWIRKLFYQMVKSKSVGDSTIGFLRHEQKYEQEQKVSDAVVVTTPEVHTFGSVIP